MSGRRYFLDQDQSSHWCLVPEDRRAEWEAWLEIDEDDERSWNRPDYALELGTNPSRVTFCLPVLEENALFAPSKLRDAVNEFESQVVLAALKRNMGNSSLSARELGIDSSNFRRVIRRLNLDQVLALYRAEARKGNDG